MIALLDAHGVIWWLKDPGRSVSPSESCPRLLLFMTLPNKTRTKTED